VSARGSGALQALLGVLDETIVAVAERGLVLVAQSTEARQLFSRQLVVLGKSQTQEVDFLAAA
jgi:transcriptional regulator of aromatic amino acid metabolism